MSGNWLAIFYNGPRATPMVLGDYLVPEGTMLVTPDLKFNCSRCNYYRHLTTFRVVTSA